MEVFVILNKHKTKVKIISVLILVLLVIISGLYFKRENKNTKSIASTSNQASDIIDDKSSINVLGKTNINKIGAENNKSISKVTKKQYIVVVDAGHGGYDPGSMGVKGTKEKDITLPVVLKLGSILENKGIKVVYTRKNDKVTWPQNEKLDLKARANIANANNADLYISIHANSSKFKSAIGAETYYSESSSKSKDLARSIQSQIVKGVKINNRGIKSSDYSVIKNTKSTAALVELAFISNINEEASLNNKNFQNQYAEAISNGILKYLGM